MFRRILLATALTTTLAAGVPANAAPGVLFFVGTATFPIYPCPSTCTGYFASTITLGADGDGGPIVAVGGNFEYSNDCAENEPLVLVMSGTLWVQHVTSTDVRSFSAIVIGTTILYFGDFEGDGLFLPSPLPSCGSSTAVNATITGWGTLVA
jgi:hypothetical protein